MFTLNSWRFFLPITLISTDQFSHSFKWDDYFLYPPLSANLHTFSCIPTLYVMHLLQTSLWKSIHWEDRNNQTSTSPSFWHQTHKSAYLDSFFFFLLLPSGYSGVNLSPHIIEKKTYLHIWYNKTEEANNS